MHAYKAKYGPDPTCLKASYSFYTELPLSLTHKLAVEITCHSYLNSWKAQTRNIYFTKYLN